MTRGRKIVNSRGTSVKVQLSEERRLIIKIIFHIRFVQFSYRFSLKQIFLYRLHNNDVK